MHNWAYRRSIFRSVAGYLTCQRSLVTPVHHTLYIACYLLFRLSSLKIEACASRAICVRETLQVAFRFTASLQMNGSACLLLLFIGLVFQPGLHKCFLFHSATLHAGKTGTTVVVRFSASISWLRNFHCIFWPSFLAGLT